MPGWCAGPVRLPGPHAAPAAGFPARPAVEWIPNGLARTVSPFAAAKGRRAPSGMDFSVTLSGFRWPALGTEVGITGLAQMPTRSRRGNIDSKSQPHPPLPGSEAPDAAGGNTASDKLMGTRSPRTTPPPPPPAQGSRERCPGNSAGTSQRLLSFLIENVSEGKHSNQKSHQGNQSSTLAEWLQLPASAGFYLMLRSRMKLDHLHASRGRVYQLATAAKQASPPQAQ